VEKSPAYFLIGFYADPNISRPRTRLMLDQSQISASYAQEHRQRPQEGSLLPYEGNLLIFRGDAWRRLCGLRGDSGESAEDTFVFEVQLTPEKFLQLEAPFEVMVQVILELEGLPEEKAREVLLWLREVFRKAGWALPWDPSEKSEAGIVEIFTRHISESYRINDLGSISRQLRDPNHNGWLHIETTKGHVHLLLTEETVVKLISEAGEEGLETPHTPMIGYPRT
jgi:hypothetical protein